MKRVLFLFLGHISCTYTLLFCFVSIFIYANNFEIKENNYFITSNSKNLVNENTTIYISENTIISNFEMKNSIIREKKIKQRKLQEKITRKSSSNSKLKKNRDNHYRLSKLKNRKLFYLPYKESTFFINSKSFLLGLYPVNYFNIIIFYSNYDNKKNEVKVKFKQPTYNYIFCDYSICLSHLEVRSPSLFI